MNIRMIATALAAILLMPVPPAAAQDQFVPGLRSVKIAVSDFDRSARFYRALGMTDGTIRPDVHEMAWSDSATRNSGVMMVSPAYAERAGMTRGGTYLMVTTPDMAATLTALAGAGFGDLGEPKAMGGMVTVLLIEDPDGNTVELLAPGEDVSGNRGGD